MVLLSYISVPVFDAAGKVTRYERVHLAHIDEAVEEYGRTTWASWMSRIFRA